MYTLATAQKPISMLCQGSMNGKMLNGCMYAQFLTLFPICIFLLYKGLMAFCEEQILHRLSLPVISNTVVFHEIFILTYFSPFSIMREQGFPKCQWYMIQQNLFNYIFFTNRFILSLSSCPMCVVVDDLLRILPISSHLRDLQPVPAVTSSTPLSPNDQELKDLKESLKESPPVGLLIELCKTLDQVQLLMPCAKGKIYYFTFFRYTSSAFYFILLFKLLNTG